MGLSDSDLIVACCNIGYDLTCGACASLFYTGANPYEHDASCKTETSRLTALESLRATLAARPCTKQQGIHARREGESCDCGPCLARKLGKGE